ncbi:TonB-dependent receptor [Neokomagataea tanensis]|uniref:TonB-dependent receptor n=2 Tax=Acetobacteraceae TaxID=433 RepID=A0A4Y6VBR8_9PROT|nr:TonB-dependent receptor [Neokomagataea tanensis]
MSGVSAASVHAASTHKHAAHSHALPLAVRPSPKTSTSTNAAPAPSVTKARILAQAQTAPVAVTATQSENVVVTGSLIRDPNFRSASPITHLTSKDLRARGITTAAQALQQLAANGSGTLPPSFSANGAFAAGASAPSLRGLTTDSTLTLMDGQRLAYYPLSDDGARNFVDSNWIPMSIMQTIDVQQDGASATYGADAVAGVVNFITRKEIRGFEGNAEGGLSEHGDSGHQRLYATFGHGSLAQDGYNFYINAEYQNDDMLYNRQRGYPYNTGNLYGIGGFNGNPNAVQSNGSVLGIGATRVATVRPVSVAANGQLTPIGGLQPLGGNCAGLVQHNVPAGAFGGTTGRFANSVCEQNTVGDYRVINPADRRISATGHFTGNINDRNQVTAMFTYSQNLNYNTGSPVSIRSQSRSGDISFANITLPVRLSNGELNPNNPFANQNQVAQIYYLFGDLNRTSSQFNQAFRGATTFSGWAPSKWGSDWTYDASFTGMADVLQVVNTGIPVFGRVQQAINDGSYNFVDPSKNSSAVRNFIAPTAIQNAHSAEYSAQATLSKGLMRLPGGNLDLAIGGNIRRETLNAPSANPDNPANPSTQYMNLNPFYAQGARWVQSGFFELNAPIVKQLTTNVSGRYDHYSAGYGRFSPKVGVIFSPVHEFTLRGTFSKGFRVPSFAETNSRTIGFVSYNPANDPSAAAFVQQHLTAAGKPNTYAQAYSIGLNTVGNPNVRPETATNFTGGTIIKPTSWMNLSVDYFYIKKSNYIAAQTQSDAIAAYYAGQTTTSQVVPDIADPDNPNAQRRPGIVNLTYVNGARLMTDGLDLALDANVALPGALSDIKWYSKGSASYVFRYNVTYPGQLTQHYAGTLGPANTTSASGTPKWRANWANTLTYKKISWTTTVYYTSGYKLTAEDYTGGGTRNDCSLAATNFSGAYNMDGSPLRCKTKAFWDIDMTFNYQFNRHWSVYANVYNVANFKAPLDLGTYGGYLYNPAWGAAGILGRAFRFGAFANF